MTACWKMLLELTSQGPLGIVVAMQPGIALACAPLIIYAWRKRGPLVPAPVAVGLALLLAGWMATAALIVQVRAAYIDRVLEITPVDPTTKGPWTLAYIAWDIDAQFAVGAAALLAISVIGAVLTARAIRLGRGVQTAIPMSASAVAIAITGLCLCWNATEKQLEGCGIQPRDRYDYFLGSYGALELAHWLVISVAAVATIAMVITSLRRGAIPNLRSTWLLIALPAAGAWLLTRGLAFDGRHPLPFDDRLDVSLLAGKIAVPEATRCEVGLDVPIAAIATDGASIDGVPPCGPGPFRDTLVSKRRLWEAIHPERSFPGVLTIAAPPDLPMTQVRMFSNVARESGYPIVQVLLEYPRDSQMTRTVGRVERSRRGCVVRATSELPRDGTWGEFAQQLQER